MYRHSVRTMLAVCGAAALIVTAAAPITALAADLSNDAQLAENVQDVLDQYLDTVAVQVEDGRVYLVGQFEDSGDQVKAADRIAEIPGVRGVYDYTEGLSGSGE